MCSPLPMLLSRLLSPFSSDLMVRCVLCAMMRRFAQSIAGLVDINVLSDAASLFVRAGSLFIVADCVDYGGCYAAVLLWLDGGDDWLPV